jgi:hypothetical protein
MRPLRRTGGLGRAGLLHYFVRGSPQVTERPPFTRRIGVFCIGGLPKRYVPTAVSSLLVRQPQNH